MAADETAGFTRAVTACALFGYSLYAFPATQQATWNALNARRSHHAARSQCT